MFQCAWTRLPVIGNLVRLVANEYGERRSQAYLLTLEEASEIIESSSSFAVGPCECRAVFKNCDHRIDGEIMMGPSKNAFVQEMPDDYRLITGEEAKEILIRSHREGLIHTIVRYRQNFYALCNCCSCCCVPLRLKKQYGIGKALVRHDDIVRLFKEQQMLISYDH